MTAQKWTAGSGAGLTWTTAITASVLNSIASGNAILSDIDIDNSSALDVYCDVSGAFGSLTSTGFPYIGVYIYPLNQDGSTFGDGRFASSAAGPPPSSYWGGNINIPVATAAFEGTVRGLVIPPGHFKFVFYNFAGAALVGSGGNTIKYRTYNLGN